MNRFWSNIIPLLIRSINTNNIIEIDSNNGINVHNILEYYIKYNAYMDVIDPLFKVDIDGFKVKYGHNPEDYSELVLGRLPMFKGCRDSNWNTTYNELKIIEKKFKDKKYPAVFLQDDGLSYAGRGLNYNSENILRVYRQLYKKLEAYRDQTNIKEQGRLNSYINDVIYENDSINGVLTTIKSFHGEFDLKFPFKKFRYGLFNEFNEIGIVGTPSNPTGNTLGAVEGRSNSLNKLSQQKEGQFGNIKIHFNQILNKLDLTEKRLKPSKKVMGKEKHLEELKIRLNHAENKLEQIENQLMLSNKLIQEKQNFIVHAEKREKAAEELNLQIDNLKASLIEMEYLNNKSRSITQRIISKFPGLYILLNINETGLKNALINIKGYKSIKKNKLLDIGYYLKNNRSVRSSGMDPILHYMYHGFKEGRKPSSKFSSDYYLGEYDDVKKSRLNPLVHYGLYGIKEGRKTDIFMDSLNHGKHENIKGHINCFKGTTVIKGWLAKIGDNNPRVAVLKIDDQNFEFICDNFRLDLKEKINSGNHSFEFIVPLNFVNGKKHKIELYDKETGKLIAKHETAWSQKRYFTDFSGFLADSLVSPVINAPFREEDKRCFAVMENIAKQLTNLAADSEENILVSVIMPVYNRAGTVKLAIDSVLTQTYRNIELVIVDDGSDDGTVELIEDCSRCR